ncbi:MAG: tetratricopeptide repeat protein [Candidatus Sericytochromatia bacterium]|nr:tetratricopeptide repeat protein [Candidatus Sericytochromatia bacterium]
MLKTYLDALLQRASGEEALASARESGLAAVSAGRHAEALPALRAAHGSVPDDREVLMALVQAARTVGRWVEVEAVLRTGLLKAPHDPVLHLDRADALRALGRTPEARTSLERVIKLAPSNAAAHARLGGWSFEDGDDAAALPSLENALQLDPRVAEPRYQVAVIALRQGDTARAKAQLTLLQRFHPTYPSTPRLLAWIAEEAADWREAARCWGDALLTEGENTDALCSLGKAHLALHERGPALEAFLMAVEVDASCHPARLAAARLAALAGERELALRLFEVLAQQEAYRNDAMEAISRLTNTLPTTNRAAVGP